MEEKQFFEEMKRLLKDYVEYTKEDMSKKWEEMEKEALAKVEESQARCDEARNKEKEARKKGETLKQAKRKLKGMVVIIGDEEYKSIEGKINQNVEKIEELGREYNRRYRELEQAKQEQQQTKATIEKEKQERLEQQKEKQGNIYEKAQGYIVSKKEEMNRDIEKKSSRLEEMRAKRREFASEAKAASELRLTLSKSTDEIKKSETYKALSKKANEELQKRKAIYKEYNQEMSRAKEELEGAQATLASFEEKYNAIDFSSEAGIQSLIDITGWEEEKEASAIEEEQKKDTHQIDDEQEAEQEKEREKIHKLTDEEVEVIEPDNDERIEELKAQTKQDAQAKQSTQAKQDAQTKQDAQAKQSAQAKQGDQPTQEQPSGNQILQDGKKTSTQMPISRIEVNSNKGKVIVHYSDGITLDPVEYDIKDVLKEKKTILWRTERVGKSDNDRFYTREILEEMTPKERKAILNSVDIFVLKALLDYEKTYQVEGSEMIKAYLHNIDIANNITKSSDKEQMPVPTIVHNLRGTTLSKSNYREVLRYANKDREIEGVQTEDAMIKVPKTWKERFGTVFHGIGAILGKAYTELQARADLKEEKNKEKERVKQERQETKARNKRERGVEKVRAKTEAKQEKEEMRRRSSLENLGMEHQEIDHEKALRNVQNSAEEREEAISLMTEDEKKAFQEMGDQLGD